MTKVYSMTNKNKLYAVRIVILVMLFQLFSSTVFALILQPDSKGYFPTVCTIQGYKQIWIETEEKDSIDSIVTSCPYCLFNAVDFDTIEADTKFYLDYKDSSIASFSSVTNTTLFKAELELLSIRAPPYFG